MSEEERLDLVKLKEETVKIKISAFDYMREVGRADSKILAAMGWKTKGDAMVGSMEMALRDIKKLTNAHLKKWPD